MSDPNSVALISEPGGQIEDAMVAAGDAMSVRRTMWRQSPDEPAFDPDILPAHARRLGTSEASSGLYAKDRNPTPPSPPGAKAFATVRSCAPLAANLFTPLFTPQRPENQKG